MTPSSELEVQVSPAGDVRIVLTLDDGAGNALRRRLTRAIKAAEEAVSRHHD